MVISTRVGPPLPCVQPFSPCSYDPHHWHQPVRHCLADHSRNDTSWDGWLFFVIHSISNVSGNSDIQYVIIWKLRMKFSMTCIRNLFLPIYWLSLANWNHWQLWKLQQNHLVWILQTRKSPKLPEKKSKKWLNMMNMTASTGIHIMYIYVSLAIPFWLGLATLIYDSICKFTR